MDKNKLLNSISQENIFLSFLNIDKITPKNIKSPFAEDTNPSFNLYYKDSKLLYKCHATGRQGDCFQLVADLNNLDIKSDFKKILELIQNNTNIHIPIDSSSINTPVINDELKFEIFDFFTQKHIDFFNKGNWNISLNLLEKYNVKPLKHLSFINRKNKKTNLNFSNKFGFVYIDSIPNSYEFYIPTQKSFDKFFLNKFKSIFGLPQISDGVENLFITAGKKDCLILNANGFPAVTFRSENHIISEAEMNQLKNISKNIYLVYDNDTPGQNAAAKILNQFDFLFSVNLPNSYNDIAEYFIDHTAQDFSILVKNVERKKEIKHKTIYDIIEEYINENYDLIYNEISLQYLISEKNKNNFVPFNENNLFLELAKKGINCSIQKIMILIQSDRIKKVNPIKDYFNNLPNWDKTTDYIEILASFVDAEKQDLFNYNFKKWLVRTVKCALNPNYFNKQAFILVHSKQNSGKTTFCRFLCPPVLGDYIAESFDNSKDARILLAKNFLFNIDELAMLSRKDINQLKAWFTMIKINERLPYARTNSIIPRICSFIGSTNQDTFLSDETGSVRWLCYNINEIDWSYKNKINIDSVWSQAFSLANDPNFDAEMSADDIQENELNNKQYQNLSFEHELLLKYFKNSDIKDDEAEFMTATDIVLHLSPLKFNLNIINIGRALTILGFQKSYHPKTKIKGYWVVKLPIWDGEGKTNSLYEAKIKQL